MAKITTAVEVGVDVKGVDTATQGLNNVAQATSNVKKGADASVKSMTMLGRAGGKLKEAYAGVSNNFSKLKKDLGGIPGPVGAVIQSVGGLSKAFKAVVANPVGIAIMAIVGALSALKAAFTDSVEGQERWNRITSVAGAIIGNFRDLVADLGEKLIDLFSKPQESLKAFGELLKNQLVNRFVGLLELIPNIGTAISFLFAGEFVKAGETAANAVGKIALGVEDTVGLVKDATKAVGDFIDQNEKEAKAADNVAQMRNKAARIERELLVERAKQEAEIAELRLKSRQEEEYTAAQRRKFILDAQDLEDSLLAKEVEVANLRFEAQKQENTFSRTNIENADKEAQAEANLYNIQTRRLTQQRATQRELNRVNKEIERDNNEAAKSAERAAAAEAKLAADRLKLLETGRKEEYDNALKDLEDYYKQRQTILNNAFVNEQMTQEQYDEAIRKLEFEKFSALLVAQQDYGDSSVATENEISAKKVEIKKQEVTEKNDADLARRDLEIQLANESIRVLGELSNLFRENSKAAKIAALAEIAANSAVAFISGLRIAQKTAEGTGPAAAFAFPIFYASQVASILGAINQAKSILKGGAEITAPSIGGAPAIGTTQFQTSGLGQDFTGSTKVYVTEGDITRTQQRRQTNQRVSVIGG